MSKKLLILDLRSKGTPRIEIPILKLSNRSYRDRTRNSNRDYNKILRTKRI